jgi:type I restriction enzyme S subunit
MIKDFTPIELGDYFGFLKSGLSRLLSQQDIGLPVLISGNIKSGRFNFDSLKYWYLNDPQGANTNNYILEKGDILLCFINSLEQIGKLAIFNGYERPCIYTTNLFRIKAKPEFDSYFLYYLLSSQLVQSEIKAITKPAVNQASFTTVEFQKIKVPFINLGKQKKIAKILSTVDNVIEKTESAIAKYQAIKQGLMHDLFTRGIDVNTGKLRPTPQDAAELYKESELGLVSKEWELETLREATNINQGLQIAISQRHKTEGKNRFVYITIQYLNNLDSDSYKYYIENPTASVICHEDDILMVRTGNTGMVVTDIVGAFHNNFFKIDYNESVLKEFLVYFLKRDIIQDLILNYAGTTTIPDLKHSDFYKIPFNKPTIIEQKLIVEKLNGIDSKIQTEQQALAKYQQLKAGLLQDLLTGKVEVRID